MSEPTFSGGKDFGSVNEASDTPLNEQIAKEHVVRSYDPESGEPVVNETVAAGVDFEESEESVADDGDGPDESPSDDSADGSSNPDASSASSG